MGYGVGASVSGSATCQNNCIVNTVNFPSQPVAVGTNDTGQSLSTSTVKSYGEIGFAANQFAWTFNNPSWAHGTAPEHLGDIQIRCDDSLPADNNTKPGCIYPEVTPVLTYSASGPYPQIAHHVSLAEASGLPGAPGGTPLTRLTDPTLKSKNQTTACGNVLKVLPPAGYTRDEYPFASTNEGAYTGGGQPRTFASCYILILGGSTGSTGYSVCMVNGPQNSLAGTALNQFYYQTRRLTGDPFYVQVSS